MYYIYGSAGPSLLIESTDSMIMIYGIPNRLFYAMISSVAAIPAV